MSPVIPVPVIPLIPVPVIPLIPVPVISVIPLSLVTPLTPVIPVAGAADRWGDRWGW